MASAAVGRGATKPRPRVVIKPRAPRTLTVVDLGSGFLSDCCGAIPMHSEQQGNPSTRATSCVREHNANGTRSSSSLLSPSELEHHAFRFHKARRLEQLKSSFVQEVVLREIQSNLSGSPLCLYQVKSFRVRFRELVLLRDFADDAHLS